MGRKGGRLTIIDLYYIEDDPGIAWILKEYLEQKNDQKGENGKGDFEMAAIRTIHNIHKASHSKWVNMVLSTAENRNRKLSTKTLPDNI